MENEIFMQNLHVGLMITFIGMVVVLAFLTLMIGVMKINEKIIAIYNKYFPEVIEEKKKSILDSLTEKELELFEMVYTKHMEYKELAKAFDISEHAVRARVYRLRLKIKERAAFIFMAILLLFMRF